MEELKNIKLERDGHILIITITRPDKLNAIDLETLGELNKAIQEIYATEDVKGAIITGHGDKSFVAGADIAEIGKLDRETGKRFARAGQETFFMIEKCNKPVIAAINGFALGGGCELALACHIRVASPNAMFSLPESTFGILPAFGGTQRLPAIIGKGRALEYALTGDKITADQALNWGLVNHVVAPEQLLPKAKEILHKIFTKAPVSTGMIIHCVNRLFDKNANGYEAEVESLGECATMEDFVEGPKAFIEKRAPVFKGQ